jgi:uncharacterized membrane protein YdfJ with MMPL/SSD domain
MKGAILLLLPRFRLRVGEAYKQARRCKDKYSTCTPTVVDSITTVFAYAWTGVTLGEMELGCEL